MKSWEPMLRQAPVGQQAAAIQRAKIVAAERSETIRDACASGKQDASFWLGLVAFEQKNYASAIDYFSKRTLAAMPGGPWTHAARYNLAHTYEVSGRRQEAIRGISGRWQVPQPLWQPAAGPLAGGAEGRGKVEKV